MKLTILGCGDAFGSGGRLQTSFHVAHDDGAFLIDCGATALIGLERAGLDQNGVSTIFITHLHGDHFAGIVWWLIHATHVAKRTLPLTITGPAGTETRVATAAEALFPGSFTSPRRFDLAFIEYAEQKAITVNGTLMTPYEVKHPSGAVPYALRLTRNGRTIAFSGDTEWTENLIPAADGADIFIADCYGYEASARFHMNWATIRSEMPRISAKRILLTHMGHDMLAHVDGITSERVLAARDGMVIAL